MFIPKKKVIKKFWLIWESWEWLVWKWLNSSQSYRYANFTMMIWIVRGIIWWVNVWGDHDQQLEVGHTNCVIIIVNRSETVFLICSSPNYNMCTYIYMVIYQYITIRYEFNWQRSILAMWWDWCFGTKWKSFPQWELDVTYSSYKDVQSTFRGMHANLQFARRQWMLLHWDAHRDAARNSRPCSLEPAGPGFFLARRLIGDGWLWPIKSIQILSEHTFICECCKGKHAWNCLQKRFNNSLQYCLPG